MKEKKNIAWLNSVQNWIVYNFCISEFILFKRKKLEKEKGTYIYISLQVV